jgi:uncharacterized protein YndB with AHSA1/START domain
VDTKLIAYCSINVIAPVDRVWRALVTPAAISEYMFGATVVSDWLEGSSIVWKGEWNGQPYQDNGVLLKVKPERTLQFTHFSPRSRLPELPENYHTVTIELAAEGSRTDVVLSQDNNPTPEARAHSEKNWNLMLAGLKRYVENQQ